MAEHEPITYKLPGAVVELHRPSNNSSHYYAVVELDGRYPGEGHIAHNVGRRESLHWLEGEAQLTVNKTTHVLTGRKRVAMNDGDYYLLEGKGRAIVFVKDQPGGQTQIEEA